jgi:hypothetical protein
MVVPVALVDVAVPVAVVEVSDVGSIVAGWWEWCAAYTAGEKTMAC